jgi:NAD(P)-dependent dehydrogenase (short-subunit alcohol dehydrogenase family)
MVCIARAGLPLLRTLRLPHAFSAIIGGRSALLATHLSTSSSAFAQLPPSSERLAGRVILITGASGGLGSILAAGCAAQGATVVLHGRVVRRLEALYDRILAAGHPEPTILPLDLAVAKAEDFADVASALQAQHGRVDAIVHTAVLLGSLGPIEHQAFDSWLATVRVDLLAPFGLTRALLPLLRAAPDASVIFTLDTRGQEPKAFWGAYAVAKAGLSALLAILADEWENVATLRVNGVVPGPMRSPLRAQTHPGDDISRLPSPDVFLPLYLYLISGQPKSESGAVIDGGRWLQGRATSPPP